MRRNLFGLFTILGLILFSIYLVIAGTNIVNMIDYRGSYPINGTILNGSIMLNISLGADGPVGAVASVAANHTHALNASYWLVNSSGPVLLTYQLNNYTGNQSIWNVTYAFINDTRLSESLYNMTINITNFSLQMVRVVLTNMTVDQFKPNLSESFINVSDLASTLYGSSPTDLNGTKFLKNITLQVQGRVEDSSGQVLIIYNTSRAVNLSNHYENTDPARFAVNGSVNGDFNNIFNKTDTIMPTTYLSASSGTGQATWNGSIPGLPHGTNVSFGVWANDSASSLTGFSTASKPFLNVRSTNHTQGFNFTVDGKRPVATLQMSEGGTNLDTGDTVTRGVTVKLECWDGSGDTLPSSAVNLTVDRPGSDGLSDQKVNTYGVSNAKATLNFATDNTGESNGEFTVYCYVTDPNGLYQATTQTFTVLSGSGGSGGSSGGSGGGGGAGGADAPETTETKTVEYASIAADTLKKIENFPSGSGLRSITFKLNSAVTGAKVEVITYATKPTTVTSSPSDKVARYIDIKTTNIPDNLIKEATITFSVAKDWMTKNSLDANEIALYRYNAGKWDKITASKSPVGGANTQSFIAKVPGFSVFAIGSTTAPVPQPEPEETGEDGTTGGPGEETGEEGTKPKSNAGLVILWIVIIAAVVGGIWYYLTKVKKPSKK